MNTTRYDEQKLQAAQQRLNDLAAGRQYKGADPANYGPIRYVVMRAIPDHAGKLWFAVGAAIYGNPVYFLQAPSIEQAEERAAVIIGKFGPA